jgi:hypothetical protein
MNNKESCRCTNQLVEIEDNKFNETNNDIGCHLYIDEIYSVMVSNSKFTSFSHNVPSQFVGYVNYEPKETSQNNEALYFPLMVMLGPHYFVLSSKIKDNINTKILPQGTSHDYFIRASYQICYSFLNSHQHFYYVHGKFYYRIEVWLEGSYLSMFPMNYNILIFHMMGKG